MSKFRFKYRYQNKEKVITKRKHHPDKFLKKWKNYILRRVDNKKVKTTYFGSIEYWNDGTLECFLRLLVH